MALTIRSAFMALGFMALGASTTLAFDAAAGRDPDDMTPAERALRQSPPGRGGHHGPGAHLLRAMAELDLTDEQRGAVERVKIEIREDKRAAFEDGRGERERMAEMIISGKVDRKELHAIIDREAAERLALAHDMTDRVLDVYDMLTPAQKSELGQLVAEKKAQMEQWEDEREPRGPRRR